MRYRLDVVAADVVDVVRFAGGWLFDRVMAGWDVTVLLTDLADRPDDRPLQILGVGVLDLEDALASVETRPRPQALGPGQRIFSDATRGSAKACCRSSITASPRSRCGARPGPLSSMTALAWYNTG